MQAVPLQFLRALLAFLGDSVSYVSPSFSMKSPLASIPSSCYTGAGTPSEELVRWQLRLEYFAYETLQDLRIEKLFDIIVDYPDRCLLIYLAFMFLCFISRYRRFNSALIEHMTSAVFSKRFKYLNILRIIPLLKLRI